MPVPVYDSGNVTTAVEPSVPAHSVAESRAPAEAPPPIAPEPVALPADLILIETDRSKLGAVNQPEALRAPRPPRVRPPAVPITDEPLVQIETGK